MAGNLTILGAAIPTQSQIIFSVCFAWDMQSAYKLMLNFNLFLKFVWITWNIWISTCERYKISRVLDVSIFLYKYRVCVVCPACFVTVRLYPHYLSFTLFCSVISMSSIDVNCRWLIYVCSRNYHTCSLALRYSLSWKLEKIWWNVETVLQCTT